MGSAFGEYVLTGFASGNNERSPTMSSTRTPAYALYLTGSNPRQIYTGMAWETRDRPGARGYGAPTDANLAAFVETFEAATQPGGANAHLGADTIHIASIVHQATGKVVATYLSETARAAAAVA